MKYNGNDIFAPFNAGLYGIDDGDSDRSMQWQESKDAILDAFRREYAAKIAAALDMAGLKYIGLEYYSPRAYSFETDSIDLELEVVDETKLHAALYAHKVQIEAAIKANVSYDGYMARTVDDFREVYRNGDLDILAVKAILSGIDFTDAQELLYEALVYEYACEKCERIHAERDNESAEDQQKIDACNARDRLEYLRGEIKAERISTSEIAELQGLAQYIEAGDVELLEWAGVTENN